MVVWPAGAEVALEVAAILGVEVKEKEPEVARVGCRYPVDRSDTKFSYAGVTDCRAAVLLNGGPKECPVGCIGLGSCVKACPFDALSLGPDNMPVVDEDKCTGCGTCVRTCPVGIMTLTSVTNRVLNEYTWEQCTAPCQRRCPAGIDVPQQIFQTKLGNYAEALKIIKERNPLPLICGRICPNPCEVDCRRNLVDEPVAINHLKRFVADYERNSGQRVQPYKAPATGRRAAVIGGGVQGLSAAYFLTRLGHEAKIFEGRVRVGWAFTDRHSGQSSAPRSPGLGNRGDPRHGGGSGNRQGLWTRLQSGVLVGPGGYETVLLAVGGWDAMLDPGRNFEPAPALPDVYLLLPLSMAWAQGRPVEVGQKVVLIAEGKTCPVGGPALSGQWRGRSDRVIRGRTSGSERG